MTPRAALAAWLLLCAVALPAASVPATGGDDPAGEEISRRADELLADPSYQTSLPDGIAPPGGSGQGRVGAAPGASGEPRDQNRGAWGEGSSRPDSTGTRDPSASALGGELITMFLWLVVAAVVAAGLIWVVREAAASRLRRARLDEAPVLPDTAAAAGPPTEDEIETLVRHGTYGEAAHLLLRRAIALLGRRRPLAESLTSREVARAAELTEPARRSFAVLVAAVEQFLFGGVALPREDYERCAEAYRQVTGRPAAAAATEDGR